MDDQVTQGEPITPLKTIPTGSKTIFDGWLKKGGYRGDIKRYLVRRYETKFSEEVQRINQERHSTK